jgi:hypothetical protein
MVTVEEPETTTTSGIGIVRTVVDENTILRVSTMVHCDCDDDAFDNHRHYDHRHPQLALSNYFYC